MNLTLQQRFANLRLFVSRAQCSYLEAEAALDTARLIDELEKAVSAGPPPPSPGERAAAPPGAQAGSGFNGQGQESGNDSGA